jgi:hypothetical protein
MKRFFDSKQVVTIVVAICFASVLAPATVIAANQLVNVADPGTGVSARVSSDGSLRVEQRASAASNAFNFASAPSSGNIFVKLYQADGPYRVALTEVSFASGLLNTTNGYAFRVELWGLGRRSGSAACGLNAAGWSQKLLRTVEVPINDTVALNFSGTALTLPGAPAGQPVCLGFYISRTITSSQVMVGGSGYRFKP